MLKTLRKHETKTLYTNSAASLKLPTAGKIHNVWVRLSLDGVASSLAEITSTISQVRFTIDGQDVVNCSGAHLVSFYNSLATKLANANLDNGVIELNIGRLIYDNGMTRDLVGLGTFDVATMEVQLTSSDEAVINKAELFSAREGIATAKLGTYPKLYNYPKSFAATGEDTMDTLPRNPKSDYLGVWVLPDATGVVSEGQLTVNSNNVFDKMPAEVMSQFANERKIAQPAKGLVYLFTNGTNNDRLPMNGVQDMRFVTSFGTAPTVKYDMLALTLENVDRSIK